MSVTCRSDGKHEPMEKKTSYIIIPLELRKICIIFKYTLPASIEDLTYIENTVFTWRGVFETVKCSMDAGNYLKTIYTYLLQL